MKAAKIAGPPARHNGLRHDFGIKQLVVVFAEHSPAVVQARPGGDRFDLRRWTWDPKQIAACSADVTMKKRTTAPATLGGSLKAWLKWMESRSLFNKMRMALYECAEHELR